LVGLALRVADQIPDLLHEFRHALVHEVLTRFHLRRLRRQNMASEVLVLAASTIEAI
jgi:hypothetical protein